MIQAVKIDKQIPFLLSKKITKKSGGKKKTSPICTFLEMQASELLADKTTGDGDLQGKKQQQTRQWKGARQDKNLHSVEVEQTGERGTRQAPSDDGAGGEAAVPSPSAAAAARGWSARILMS